MRFASHWSHQLTTGLFAALLFLPLTAGSLISAATPEHTSGSPAFWLLCAALSGATLVYMAWAAVRPQVIMQERWMLVARLGGYRRIDLRDVHRVERSQGGSGKGRYDWMLVYGADETPLVRLDLTTVSEPGELVSAAATRSKKLSGDRNSAP